MDLSRLATYANAISPMSPSIRRYALEQLRVTRDQELRLAKLESAPGGTTPPPFTALLPANCTPRDIANFAASLATYLKQWKVIR